MTTTLDGARVLKADPVRITAAKPSGMPSNANSSQDIFHQAQITVLAM